MVDLLCFAGAMLRCCVAGILFQKTTTQPKYFELITRGFYKHLFPLFLLKNLFNNYG